MLFGLSQDADGDSIDKESATGQPEVDDEGFSVIPVHPRKEDDSWEDSSSDSGSDTEDKTRRLKVRNICASFECSAREVAAMVL